MNTLQMKNMFCEILIRTKQARIDHLKGFITNHDLIIIEIPALRAEIVELKKIQKNGL